VDDLRPNIAYELGFFHGQGTTVLLVTNNEVERVWRSISDLAGCALLTLSGTGLDLGISEYLNALYAKLASTHPIRAPELPIRAKNQIGELSKKAQIPTTPYESDFGDAIRVDTWGGVVFEIGANLLPDAGYKIAIRGESYKSTYSIYFHVRFPDSAGTRKSIWLGLTSNQALIGFEANERNLPSQALTQNWRLLTGTFAELLKAGHIYGTPRVEFIELIRVRAGGYKENPFEKNPAFEIGYFELTGTD
jgi:hypothetical protein